MKHKYNDIPGWFLFRPIYEQAIKNAKDGAVFVEVGAFLGKSTHYMATEIFNSKKKVQFHVVDIWLIESENQRKLAGNDSKSLFLENLKPFLKKKWFHVHHTPSIEASKLFEDKSLDFVLIDADHSYEAVKEDLRAWVPKIKPGGVIAGDDYTSHTHPGVRRAVDEYFPNVERVRRNWRVQL